ncbi:hypothetical protein [Bacteroides sp. An19]|uniref:hypothetical protein n=1 Tax=Bacteroides sp. An19 TaxID=1965580 RepID=UPI000B396D00|nr:hypothetical protein [Bacteroides sp. An19]OUP37284.1 hypothetical protein B5F25_00360 [Bacteroides sp. An19]
MKEFSSIFELITIREQKSRLTAREEELMSPILTDMELVPVIFRWYCGIVGNSGVPERRKAAEFRQKFIFIILFLYSPSTLAGGKMKIGLRDKITEVTGGTGTLISHSYTDLMFRYQMYKGYREEIDSIYKAITGLLRENGYA